MHPVAVVPAGDAHGSHSEAAMADVISAFAGQLSLLLALLFALHPMFVPMVAWIPTRGDFLLTIFVIISFILFIKSSARTAPSWSSGMDSLSVPCLCWFIAGSHRSTN